jgi:hypothetical protein
LLTKNRKAFYLVYLNICLKIWKGILIFISLIIIFHLEPFPNDLEIKIFDLVKNISILPIPVLSVAWGPKLIAHKPPKALFSVAKGTFQTPVSHRKGIFLSQ